MNKLVINEDGKLRNADMVAFVDKVFDLKNQKGPWAVIDAMVQHWVESSPEEVKALKVNISDVKENNEDKEYGQTMEGKDFERRMKLIFPYRLQQMIRAVYKANELEMNEEFYDEFAKRYPGFKVAEKS